MKDRSAQQPPTPDDFTDQVDDDWRWQHNLPALRGATPIEITITADVVEQRGLTADDFEEFLATGNATSLQRAVVREQIADYRERGRRRPTLIQRVFGLPKANVDVVDTLRAITEVNNTASTAIASDYELQGERIRRHGVQQEFRTTQLRHKTRMVEEEIKLVDAEERLERIRNRGLGPDPTTTLEINNLRSTIDALKEHLRRQADPREHRKICRDDEIADAEHEARLSEVALRKARNVAAAKNLRQPPRDEFAEALAAQEVINRRVKRLDDEFDRKLADAERKHGVHSDTYQSLLTQYNKLRVRILETGK